MKQVMNMKRSTDMKRSMNLIDAMAKSLLIATFWLPAAALAQANVPLTGSMAAPGAGAPAARTAATAAPATPVPVTTAPATKPAPAAASTLVVTDASHIPPAAPLRPDALRQRPATEPRCQPSPGPTGRGAGRGRVCAEV